jgi:hypothetical protein
MGAPVEQRAPAAFLLVLYTEAENLKWRFPQGNATLHGYSRNHK